MVLFFLEKLQVAFRFKGQGLWILKLIFYDEKNPNGIGEPLQIFKRNIKNRRSWQRHSKDFCRKEDDTLRKTYEGTKIKIVSNHGENFLQIQKLNIFCQCMWVFLSNLGLWVCKKPFTRHIKIMIYEFFFHHNCTTKKHGF